MKRYKIELNLTEEDVSGDEFWEEAIKDDPTGISPLIEEFKRILIENFFINDHEKIDEIVKIVEYTDK